MVYVVNRQRTKCFEGSIETTGWTDLDASCDDQDDRRRRWKWAPLDSVWNTVSARDTQAGPQSRRMETVSGSNRLGCRAVRWCMDARQGLRM